MAGVVGAGGGVVVQVGMVVVVTRAFPPEVAGEFFAFMALGLMVAGIVRLDAGNGVVHALARTARSGYIRAAVVPVLALSLATAVTLHLLADRLAPLLGVPSGWLRVIAWVLPLMTCSDILISATRGSGTMRPTLCLGGLLQPVAQFTLVACAAWTGTAAGLPLAWALPYAVVLVAAVIWLRRLVPSPFSGSREAYGELWSHTGPRALGGGLQAVFQRFDIVIVTMLAGPVEAAWYTAATRVKVIGQLAGQGLAQAAQPRLVRALARKDLPRARRIYQVTTLWLVVATWPLWVGYALLAPWVLPIFGPGYERAAPVAVVVAVTMMAASACGLADVVLTAAGHTATSLAVIAAALAVTVALDLLLVPLHGALGAALGWSAGVLVKNLLPLLRLRHAYDLRPFGPHTRDGLRPARLP